ncbi:CxC2 domain-containing protein [Mycena kentingensis (nom. inval.)]|nr:CxC2 domain-containing protein [Mycena kentingensis (nom. inval.)]
MAAPSRPTDHTRRAHLLSFPSSLNFPPSPLDTASLRPPDSRPQLSAVATAWVGRYGASFVVLQHTSSILFIASRNGLVYILLGTPSVTVGCAYSWVTKAVDAQTPRRARDGFVVLDASGIHDVHIDYCGCYHSRDPDFLQLLRVGWYPSTTTAPQTCATFACLERFHVLSLHGKTSVYDFYAALESLTNGVGVKPPDRYKVFLRIVRQYRHLLLLKRGGRGHDRYGVIGTGPGELARRCPVCPRPGVNVPENWQSASPQERFLYTMTHYGEFTI